MENLEVRTLLAADLMAAGSHEDIADATSVTPIQQHINR